VKPKKIKKDTFKTKGRVGSANVEEVYEVVSPPPTIDPYKGFSWGALLIKASFLILFVGGLFVSWPFWSPYIDPYFPILKDNSTSDPQLRGLVDRITALESRVDGEIKEDNSISDLEVERTRLQNGVEKLFNRLQTLEKSHEEVKQMFADAGVYMDNEEAQRTFDKLTERLSLLERRGGDVASLAGRLHALESTGSEDVVFALKRAEDMNQRLNLTLKNLQERLNKVEQSGVAELRISRIPTIILAVSQLRRSVLSGRPFLKDLNVLRGVLSSNDGMKAPVMILERYSKSGISTILGLRQYFTKISRVLVTKSRVTKKSDDWYENIRSRIFSLVSIRRIDGDSDESSLESYILKVEKFLETEDLRSAVKAFKELTVQFTEMTKIVEPWLNKANARLLAERAITSLHVSAIALLDQDRR